MVTPKNVADIQKKLREEEDNKFYEAFLKAGWKFDPISKTWSR